MTEQEMQDLELNAPSRAMEVEKHSSKWRGASYVSQLSFE